MSIRHTLVIKDENEKTVYEKQILGNNFYADELFYKNLRLEIEEDGLLEQTTIDFEDLVYEWWSYISRILNREKYFQDLEKELEQNNKELIFLNSTLFNQTLLGDFYITIYEITRNYTEEFNFKKLKKDYKLYLKIN